MVVVANEQVNASELKCLKRLACRHVVAVELSASSTASLVLGKKRKRREEGMYACGGMSLSLCVSELAVRGL